MAVSLGEKIKRLRMTKNLSQKQLADLMHVERASVANWEGDRRVPPLETISYIADFFNISLSELLSESVTNTDNINVLMVDDEKIILDGDMDILRGIFPNAVFNGFTTAKGALAYAENNKVDLAFLDVELGSMNGIELCERLLEFNRRTNVIYVTGYSDYAVDAWATGASGFLLKPLSEEKVRQAISMLRYPLGGAV